MPGFLSGPSLPNLTVLRHDVRTDGFPEGSFGLVHVRAVLMHIADRMAALRRMASWLAPGGWLVAEEAGFGMWLADYDPDLGGSPGGVARCAAAGMLLTDRFLAVKRDRGERPDFRRRIFWARAGGRDAVSAAEGAVEVGQVTKAGVAGDRADGPGG